MSATGPRLVTSAVVAVSDSQALFDHLIARMREGSVELERPSPEHVRMFWGGASLAMERRDDGLHFRIEAADASNLQLWRESAVERVAGHVPVAARGMRWSDELATAGAPPPNFRTATVVGTGRIMTGLRRVELVVDAPLGPGGIHARLLLPPANRIPLWPVIEANGASRWPDGPDALHSRAYTIRRPSGDGARLAFDVVDHAGGRVAEWAAHARIGDAVGVLGPGGGNEMPDTDGDLVIAGDMTALPAMARILDDLPDARVRAWAACPSQADADAYFGTGRVMAIAPAGFDARIVDLLRAQASPDAAWFAGELGTAKAVRRMFTDEWTLGRRRRLAAAYWQR